MSVNIESVNKMMNAVWPTALYEQKYNPKYAVCANIHNHIRVFAMYTTVEKAEQAVHDAMNKHGFNKMFDLTVVDTGMWFPVPFVVPEENIQYSKKQTELSKVISSYRASLVDQSDNLEHRRKACPNEVTTPLQLYRKNVENTAKLYLKQAVERAVVNHDVADNIMTHLLDVDYKDLQTEFANIKNALNQNVLKETQEEIKKIDSKVVKNKVSALKSGRFEEYF